MYCKQINESHYDTAIGNEWENVANLILTTLMVLNIWVLIDELKPGFSDQMFALVFCFSIKPKKLILFMHRLSILPEPGILCI